MRTIAVKGTLAQDALNAGFTFIKCGSHRARDKLTGGQKTLQCYYSHQRADLHGIYAVELDGALPLPKGCTKLRGPFTDLMMCWG